MAIAYKDSQIQGTASVGTYATLYSTPASATAVVSTITVCNTASTAATYRIGLAGSASTPGDGNWLAYGSTVNGNDTVALTLGVSLGASKFLRVSSSASTVAFSAFVSEIS
jgi:hypothetical protein